MTPIGEELRAIRRHLGWSLQNVEIKSSGRFKAVVVGSWERSDRHPPVESIRDLLAFYGGYSLVLLRPGDRVYRPCEECGQVPAHVTGWAIDGRTR